MRKLLKGICEFQRNAVPEYRETFAKLALGQSPDALFIGCSDSRVAVNVFASTDPGDLFVVRNVGNLVPPCGSRGISTADESEAAAIEFAVSTLNVSDIIICGHSECGAMQALITGREKVLMPNLKSWLRHGDVSLQHYEDDPNWAKEHKPHNRLSQRNVIDQMEHLLSYPIVQERVQLKKLKIHGWWFEVANATVHAYDKDLKKFVILDEKQSERILSSLNVKS